MFLTSITICICLLAIIAVFQMDTIFKAFMFLVLLTVAFFILFLFINHPFPSALSVISIMAVFAIKFER